MTIREWLYDNEEYRALLGLIGFWHKVDAPASVVSHIEIDQGGGVTSFTNDQEGEWMTAEKSTAVTRFHLNSEDEWREGDVLEATHDNGLEVIFVYNDDEAYICLPDVVIWA